MRANWGHQNTPESDTGWDGFSFTLQLNRIALGGTKAARHYLFNSICHRQECRCPPTPQFRFTGWENCYYTAGIDTAGERCLAYLPLAVASRMPSFHCYLPGLCLPLPHIYREHSKGWIYRGQGSKSCLGPPPHTPRNVTFPPPPHFPTFPSSHPAIVKHEYREC